MLIRSLFDVTRTLGFANGSSVMGFIELSIVLYKNFLFLILLGIVHDYMKEKKIEESHVLSC